MLASSIGVVDHGARDAKSRINVTSSEPYRVGLPLKPGKKRARSGLLVLMEELELRVGSLLDAMRHRDALRSVETYCMFIGYPHSGHSLTGSLLDAHPRMVIAHELDALNWVRAGVGRKRLFALLLRRSKQFTRQGRAWGTYAYTVEGQWQGRFDRLEVIGDKKGGISTLHLRRQPELLDRLREVIGVRLRVIHIVRNPYDNITTMLTRGRVKDLDAGIETYFERCETNAELEKRLSGEELLTMHHETFLENSISRQAEICRFLGVDAGEEYLQACAKLVSYPPNRTRTQVDWPHALREKVAKGIERYEFLEGYSFNSE